MRLGALPSAVGAIRNASTRILVDIVLIELGVEKRVQQVVFKVARQGIARMAQRALTQAVPGLRPEWR